MQKIIWPGNEQWPQWQKILFRFFFLYFIIYQNLWTLIYQVHGLEFIAIYYGKFAEWRVNFANEHLFHFYKVLIPENGSGDTSFAWTEMCEDLLLALIGCAVWTLIDARRNNYNRIAYWLRIIVRYFVIFICFRYGFYKVFLTQMSFPSPSEMATPLGDFLPMRLSWMFMGYSSTYQFFAGLMEVIAGLLLLFRRTSTFGAIIAAGAFANVMMMNMGYDIPVKLASTCLFIYSLVLLSFEYKRIFAFFTNKVSSAGNLYKVEFPKLWMKISVWTLKIIFVIFMVIIPFKDAYNEYVVSINPKSIKPIQQGMYEVSRFAVNHDTIPFTYNDSLRWKDVIFENDFMGSIGTTDTLFRQRYRRGYFDFSFDSSRQNIIFSKLSVTFDSVYLFSMKYEMPDSNTILLSGAIRKDSVFAELKKTDRHFQLAEKQFHWLNEYVR